MLVLVSGLIYPSAGLPNCAEENLFRIGTGGSAGAYFPIGALIAKGIGDPVQEQLCLDKGTIEIFAVSQRSNGSVTNVKDIGSGLLESGLAQADVVHWAYHGTEAFEQSGPISGLRTIATLYLESLHLVAHVDSEIESIADLRGKTVSVDEEGSGTRLNAQHILESQKVKWTDVQAVYLKAGDAIDRIRKGQLDAFFVVAGYPVAGVAELIEDGIGKIVPASSVEMADLYRDFSYFTAHEIPENTYGKNRATETLAVPAQWIVSDKLDDELVYEITRRFWSEASMKQLRAGHPKGQEVQFATALMGLSAPLHPGARKYYEQAGQSVIFKVTE